MHEYQDTITPGVLINNHCYGKSQVRITRDFLFVDLRKVPNSLTSRFLLLSKLSISITIHDATKSRIIFLTKTFIKFLVSYVKDTKDSEARQLIKP